MRSLVARLVPAALALLLAGCAARAPAEPVAPQLSLERCRLSTPGAAESVAARCASLSVPEDHANPGGRRIALRVVVVPAVGRGGAADPLLLLAGGPGQAASEAFVPLLPSLGSVNQQRDLVLVDQRGTGGSSPLSCPLEGAEASADDAAYAAWVRTCLGQLTQTGADPAHYTTESMVRDLELVRAALGYDQVNLLGVSYGTRVALTYMRLFPERVRSAVLDGVAPQELAIGATMGQDAQRAMDLMLARCASDPGCRATFPNLGSQLDALLAGLEAAPATVALDDPLTGAPTSVELDRDSVAATLQTLSYAPESVALLPLLIQTAAAGDLRPLAAQSLLVGQQLAESVDLGLRFAVICAEDAPFYVQGGTPAGYLGDLMPRVLAAPCAEWPRGEIAPDFKQPVAADTPTLLLSGEADPVTPPENGAQAARTLPNSQHIVAPGQGHNVFFRGCLPRLVAEFIEAASTAALDASCVERLEAPPFFLSFTGTVRGAP